MKNTIIIDRKHFDDCTIGRAKYELFNFLTLELPWLGNQKSISCIAPGIYSACKYISPSNGECIAILDVKHRTHIQMHSANFTYQILGCIAVGDGIKYLNNDDILDVTNSRATLKALLAVLPKKFEILIK